MLPLDAAQHLHRARAIRDVAIEQASKSLVRYVDAVGGPEKRRDPKVVEVHIDALGRLALLLGDGLARAAAILVNQEG